MFWIKHKEEDYDFQIGIAHKTYTMIDGFYPLMDDHFSDPENEKMSKRVLDIVGVCEDFHYMILIYIISD